MREIKFKFLMENGEITTPYHLKELIDADSYINIECEYNSKVKTELQYTELKDKNRIEIYEGDIVKFKYTSSDYKKAYIEWNNEKASYDFVDNETKLNYSYNFRQINNIEVIGNIYENKEFLNN